MTRDEIIRNLKYTMEKHKNDTVNTFDTNISVMCKDILEYLEQEPCEDAISRQAVLDCLTATGLKKYDFILNARNKIKSLPSVNPQTGHWIKYGKLYQCSECKELSCCKGKFCNECGTKMVEPQEGEVKE